MILITCPINVLNAQFCGTFVCIWMKWDLNYLMSVTMQYNAMITAVSGLKLERNLSNSSAHNVGVRVKFHD